MGAWWRVHKLGLFLALKRVPDPSTANWRIQSVRHTVLGISCLINGYVKTRARNVWRFQSTLFRRYFSNWGIWQCLVLTRVAHLEVLIA